MNPVVFHTISKFKKNCLCEHESSCISLQFPNFEKIVCVKILKKLGERKEAWYIEGLLYMFKCNLEGKQLL